MSKAIRVGTIEIATVKRDYPMWITAHIQGLEVNENGKVTSQSMRRDKILKRVDEVATQLQTIVDPVTGQSVTASIAGVGKLVKAAMIRWMLEENPGTTYDSDKDLVIFPDDANS